MSKQEKKSFYKLKRKEIKKKVKEVKK